MTDLRSMTPKEPVKLVGKVREGQVGSGCGPPNAKQILEEVGTRQLTESGFLVASNRGHGGPREQTGVGGPSRIQGAGCSERPDLEPREAPSQPLRAQSRKLGQSFAILGGKFHWPQHLRHSSLAPRGPWVGGALLHSHDGR